jgi:hypothetical protein
MYKRLILPACLAGLAGMVSLAAPAVSAPFPANPPLLQIEGGTSASVEEVRHRPRADRRALRYDRRIHGDRCLRRYGSCRHYYGGYYYRTPWWLIAAPFVGAQIVIGGKNYGSRHVAWCEDRYRSYNRRNNTWISYSGEVRQCDSPYDRR